MKEPFIRARNRVGRCFELSFKVLLTYPKWSLVHGFVRIKPNDDSQIMAHAWCEKDGVVHDPVLNANFDKDFYYNTYVVAEQIHYDSVASARASIASGHSGPWDEPVSSMLSGTYSLEDLKQKSENKSHQPGQENIFSWGVRLLTYIARVNMRLQPLLHKA